MEVISYQHYEFQREFEKRQRVDAINCPVCNKELLPDLIEGMPYYCNDCKKSFLKDGKEVSDFEEF